VTEYARSFQDRDQAATQSALDLSQIARIVGGVDELAGVLSGTLADVAGAVSLARDRAQKFELPEYVDLGDFAVQLEQRLKPRNDVQTAISRIRGALDPTEEGSFVIENRTSGRRLARATGVSIYLPGEAEYAPDYDDLLFSRQCRWRGFLEALCAV
jgi:hypothetical protein